MTYLTLAQIRTKVLSPIDMEEETGDGEFIQTSVLDGFINDGIDKAEAIIHRLYEDYFKTSASLALVSGQTDISLPSDIYANKIRSIIYDDGSDSYEIEEMRGSNAFKEIPNIETSNDYQYMLVNLTTGVKIRLFPASRITNSTYVTCWYIRNAKVLSAVSDQCDIPEFVSYVIEYAKGQCLAKENGGVVPAAQQAIIDGLEQDMITTLSDRVPDAHNEVEKDTSHYEEHN